jgi:hypothetical protein
VLFQCTHHHEIHDNLHNLENSIKSQEFKNFITQHAECSNINILPVLVKRKVTIKCNECRFVTNVITTNNIDRVRREILNCTTSSSNALNRAIPNHKTCQKHCQICPLIWKNDAVSDCKKTHYRLMSFNCQLKGVIYVIHCRKCNNNYVGMTTNKVKNRLASHLSNIANRKSTSVAKHFNSAGHVKTDIQVGIIDTAHNTIDLKLKEAHWIRTLQTIQNDINKKNEANSQIDYQLSAAATHFRHSKSCFPYLTDQILEITTLNLNSYKRIMIPKRRRPTRK